MNYKDTDTQAEKNINKLTKSRSMYYEVISNQTWGMKENYDLHIKINQKNLNW